MKSMIKFYSFGTSKYDALTHKTSYLYSQYDKIHSFIEKRMGNEIAEILAKPIVKDGVVSWHSTYENLKAIYEQDEKNKNEALVIYYELIDKINEHIKKLIKSADKAEKDWAELLKAIFNSDNNEIWTNGTNICIVWGWGFKKSFENKRIARFHEKTIEQEHPGKTIGTESEHEKPKETPPITNDNDNIIGGNRNDLSAKGTFWEFLKWFALKYWRWLLWMLLAAILLLIIVLLYNCCRKDQIIEKEINKINQRIDEIRMQQERCHPCGNETIVDTTQTAPSKPPQAQIDSVTPSMPRENCGVHFSGLVMGGAYSSEGISKIYKIDKASEYVGSGHYTDNTKAFPKAVQQTFDGIAIDKGTRLIIYSKKNFNGKVLIDVSGPMIINNVLWKSDPRYNQENKKNFEQALQDKFPQSTRKWSSSNMHDWSYGSCKIICENN